MKNGKKLQFEIMSILILGGAGFVGRHYAEYFLKKKEFVEVVDNIAPLSGGIHPKNGNYLIHSNIRNLNFIKKIVENFLINN